MRKTFRSFFFYAFLVNLFVLFVFPAFSQVKIMGTVLDAKSGQPLVGATVKQNKTNQSTVTNKDGSFTINAALNEVLKISYVGYETKDVRILSTSLSIQLSPAAESLNDVVVIGYGTARRKDLTGAVTTIQAKDFQQGMTASPMMLIAGKVPGLSITSSGGQPGGATSLRIRGGSSLVASNDPLIVIDGMPLNNGDIAGASNPLSFLNPDDIESFTVLKDASSSAIYGARSANGIIMITTKKGSSSKVKFNFNTDLSASKLIKQVDNLTGDQIRTIVNQNGTAVQKAQLGTANTDWQDAIYQTAIATSNTLSISGGIKNLPYRLSVGYAYLNGILKTDHLQRTSIGLVMAPSFFDKHLKLTLNLNAGFFNTRFGNQDAIVAAATFDPTQNIYSNNNRYGGYFEWTEPNGDLKLNRLNNPVGLINQKNDIQKPRTYLSNLQLEYKFHFLPDLKFNLNLGMSGGENNGTIFISDSAASNYVIGQPGKGGLIKQGKQTRQATNFDMYFNYAKEIKSIQTRVEATLGYTYSDYSVTNYNYRDYNAKGDTIAGTTAPTYPFDKPQFRLIGYFGRLLLNHNEKYFLTASLRRDGTSKFSQENRWHWFPSVGLAWNIKNENFLKNNKTFSALKFRMGYGVTAQQDGIENYGYIPRYSLGSYNGQYSFGDNSLYVYTPTAVFKPLAWERANSYNLALDFGLLDNRISGSIDFYYKNTVSMLNRAAYPALTNFSAYLLANVGSMLNKGVEVNLNFKPIIKENFSWEFNINATYNKNEITQLTLQPNDSTFLGTPTGTGNAGVNGFLQMYSVGQPRNVFYLYKQVYDANGKPIEGLMADLNRDGIINEKDKYFSKSPFPNLFFGFTNSLSYKKWGFQFTMRANFNNYVYNNIYSGYGKLNQILGTYTLGNASTNYLTTGFVGNTDIQNLSDYYLQNASFLKMDNIYLSYNYGKLGKSGASLRLGLSVQNVFTITKFSGLDPEIFNGIEFNLYPRPRTFSLNANINF